MYKRILVALDGSPRAEMILSHVAELAQRLDAAVLMLHVSEPPPVMVSPYDAVPMYGAQEMDEHVKRMELYLTDLGKPLQNRGVQVEKFVETGPVAGTIIAIAEREKADLIAMTSHGRSGLARVFYGSVAAAVLHQIDRPLLLIRAAD